MLRERTTYVNFRFCNYCKALFDVKLQKCFAISFGNLDLEVKCRSKINIYIMYYIAYLLCYIMCVSLSLSLSVQPLAIDESDDGFHILLCTVPS